MSRKLKKGYFVKGQFVAEGSELDLEYKRELKGTDEASRTDLKRESTELQKLGEELVTLRADLMARLALPDKLVDALVETKRITNFEGRRRQMQFIGKQIPLLHNPTPHPPPQKHALYKPNPQTAALPTAARILSPWWTRRWRMPKSWGPPTPGPKCPKAAV